MKEATGELNMTVITMVAIAAIGAVFYFLVWPAIQATLATRMCVSAYGSGYSATKQATLTDTGSATEVNDWCCVFEGNQVGVDDDNLNLENHRLSDGTDCTAAE